ncbi:uncharacterized protein PODANS_6_1980 [Podospora anserina S mat+]|uniref:Podospora anserina S mat+ genomic DNA chromosome 6, supercontig 2 n=1 Tax=Podospora anserina (strain S / ATCC MYA-4624 / DSM 980 / FGSC 10383) TaxID=515849 RepID=B2B2V4_PODAN|nr:uncharacterized protein PODANS_6_1980 [Podospora anserina S mat+]CAP71440.1 unnamed protein product [Podospora anserina S mat+]
MRSPRLPAPQRTRKQRNLLLFALSNSSRTHLPPHPDLSLLRVGLPFHAPATSFSSLGTSLFMLQRPRLETLIHTSLTSGLFLSMLDASIIATSLFSIASDMKNFEHINWVALAYGLTYLGFAALFARVSDVVGRGDAFVVAFCIFIAFSLGCGFSETIEQLIICRAFQGVGAGGLYSISMIVLPELTPDKNKKYIGAIVGMVIATSGVIGPVLGGVLTQYITWRWVFWALLVLWLSCCLFRLGPPRNICPFMRTGPGRSWTILGLSFCKSCFPTPLPVFANITNSMAFAVLVVFPFQNLSSQKAEGDLSSLNPYAQPTFIYPLVGAALALLLLIGWQTFAIRGPRKLKSLAFAFPPSLCNRKYIATILVTALTGFPYLLSVYAFPIRFQVVHGKSSLEAGLMLLPMLASSAIGTVTASLVNNGCITGQKKPRFFETFLLACLTMLIGCAAQTTLGDTDDGSITGFDAKDVGLLSLIGFGFGMSACGATMFINLESPIGDHASAQGIIAQFRILGGSIGIAVSSAILGGKLRPSTTPEMSSLVLAHIVSPTPDFGDDDWAAVRKVYTSALREDMKVCCGVLAAAVVCSLFVYRRYWLTTGEIMELRYEEELDRRIGLLREDVEPHVMAVRDKLIKIREEIFEGKRRPFPGIKRGRTRLGEEIEGV